MSEKLAKFDAHQCNVIERALLIGLTCLGEIERAQNASMIAKAGNRQIPQGVDVAHPTGDAESVCVFAEAMTYLSYRHRGTAQ